MGQRKNSPADLASRNQTCGSPLGGGVAARLLPKAQATTGTATNLKRARKERTGFIFPSKETVLAPMALCSRLTEANWLSCTAAAANTHELTGQKHGNCEGARYIEGMARDM
eukprot:GGOE01025269.1.p2 GENE.GGOE01025269.1~~GGOE01025269.1.p2  ORF type:complete len:112 (-),score=0.10 GGOE01025269.1:165-500(-)